MKFSAALFSVFFSLVASAQPQTPTIQKPAGAAVVAPDKPAPPQTARQALIEMISGGQKSVAKHLTNEVQQLLAQSSQIAPVLGIFDSMRASLGSSPQVFDSGPLLVAVNQTKEHGKLEIRIESDDLNGDEDTIVLSPHAVRESSDQAPEEWEAFLSNFSVQMKKQEGIWRLNKIGVGLEMAVGDPEFIKKLFPPPQQVKTKAAATGSDAPRTEPQENKLSPAQMVLMIGMMEYTYAQGHPEIGFSCSLSELTQNANPFYGDAVITGDIFQGYKLSVTGCQGKPAGSYQVVAEPVAAGGQAFCTDATRNVRVADDGRGSTCLAAGRFFGADAGTNIIVLPPSK